MNHVFADTSFWFALAVRSDGNHEETRSLNDELQSRGALLFISDLVLAETHRLILHKIGIGAGRLFLDLAALQMEKDFVRMLPVTMAIIGAARVLRGRFRDQKITLADACSAVLTKRHGLDAVASFDGHFEVMELARVP